VHCHLHNLFSICSHRRYMCRRMKNRHRRLYAMSVLALTCPKLPAPHNPLALLVPGWFLCPPRSCAVTAQVDHWEIRGVVSAANDRTTASLRHRSLSAPAGSPHIRHRSNIRDAEAGEALKCWACP
jgi:hypothetical protein